MLKVSNETKVGALAAIAITILILGYNFLSGKGDLFSTQTYYFGHYSNVSGITESSPVVINGYRVGKVRTITQLEDYTSLVQLSIKEDVKIPVNSVFKVINLDIFGGKGIEIIIGDEKILAKENDTLQTATDAGFAEAASKVLKPLTEKLDNILTSLDSVLDKDQIGRTFNNLNLALVSFTKTTDKLNNTIESNYAKLGTIFSNVESLTNTLKQNNEKFSQIIGNLNKVSSDIAASNLKQTIENADKSLVQFTQMLEKINKGEGTLGQLANNKELYDNLNKAVKDLDALVVDLKQFPEKYVPIPGTKKQRRKAKEASNAANKG